MAKRRVVDSDTGEIIELSEGESFFMIRDTFDMAWLKSSLSVSDVIVIRQNGAFSAHYVDSIGFVELPGFCSGKNPLRSLEDSIEQNDNQLDGIINNLPCKPEPKERQTIQERLTAGREALRHQPKLQKKAPVKSLEE